MRRSPLNGMLLAITASVFLTVSTAAWAQKLTELEVRLSFIANVQYGDYYVAIEDEIFKKNGLDVTLVPGGPGAPNSLTELASGNVDIAIANWLPFVDSLKLGNDFVVIGVQFQSSPLGIMSLAKDPILTAKDMSGERILAQRGVATMMVKTTLKAAGLDPESVDIIPAGFSPDPLIAGDGKGYTGFGSNQRVALEVMGLQPEKDFFFRSFDELGSASVTGLVVVKRDFLEQNRDVLVKYMASLIQGHLQSEENPDYAPKLAVEKFGIDYGLDLAQQKIQNRVQFDFIRPGADPDFRVYSINSDKIAGPVLETTRLTGRDELPANILDFVDTSIVEDAWTMVE